MNVLMYKKLKAFTLLELSVVMVIAGLVFAISFSAYNIINRQYTEFKNTSEKILDISMITSILTKEFSEAGEIRKTGNELLLTKTDGNRIIYRFESDALIRKDNEVEDKFENIVNEKISFLGAEQTESNGLVDELYFEIGKDAFPLHVKKYYAADVLMEEKIIIK